LVLELMYSQSWIFGMDIIITVRYKF
jgi:hypothetical protein